MASISVPPNYDLPFIAAAAGNANSSARHYSRGKLFVEGVTQQALDDAFAAYNYLDTVKARKKRALGQDADAWLYGQFSLQRMVFAALNIGNPGDIANIKKAAQDRNSALGDAETAVDAAATEEEVTAIVFEDYLP